ncbi:Probable chromosome-partitioning protein parB [uncultured Butyricicoccus sp.]|uniref:Chromosome partitioning protein ParB n=1 Tax=Butyricicoccus faecihominis TaxID=1712515 RepID=A0ABQ1E0J3_9FIRM|nr:ParB/RepB/Spo0J family partition protein [Butyricicoccus faecihominis]GFO88490.1 chromosome partitioning protein ParB [Butyricicoccus faecihominis]GGM67615.1 chromosome partitioning protein ParB [Butyricicoccus faecihominis]SCJ74835.1 Probable chromosome-partitioning protein parB [uncultured Butyricicoccus sp.]
MKSAAKNIQLASYDDLFKTDEERQADAQERIQNLPLDKLEPFPNHPFKVIDDDKMLETVESIKERGVLVPILVRPKNDGNFEIVSGHRRHHASQLAGLTEIPAIVREMDDDTAILLMVDSNLQREELLPSEKAFAYKMKLDAMKRQGQRTDLTSAQIGRKFDGKESRELLAEQVGESRNQISRFIRLTNLVPNLLDRVDNKTMAFNAAVEVSYLTEPEQLMLCDAIEREECTPNLSQAKRLKQYSQDGKLDENVMDAIMTEEKPIEDKLVLKGDVLAKYFPRTYTPSQKQKIIVKLLEDWHKRQLRQQER